MADTSISFASSKRVRSSPLPPPPLQPPQRRPWKRYMSGFLILSCIIIYRYYVREGNSDSTMTTTTITDFSSHFLPTAFRRQTDLASIPTTTIATATEADNLEIKLATAVAALEEEKNIVTQLRIELKTAREAKKSNVNEVVETVTCPPLIVDCPPLSTLLTPPNIEAATTMIENITTTTNDWTDTNGLPLSSTVDCSMTADGADLCVYENLCFDVPDADVPTVIAPILLSDPILDDELEHSGGGDGNAGGGGYVIKIYAHGGPLGRFENLLRKVFRQVINGIMKIIYNHDLVCMQELSLLALDFHQPLQLLGPLVYLKFSVAMHWGL